MSGDVQPRKRKEKRRKRAEEEYHIQRIRRASLEDDDSGTPPPMLVNPLEQSMENVTIHIHKEGGGTGGHWCARILFFALFTVLVGLIGVIIFEYRGTTDVDTPVATSRWATIFEGWVDDIAPLHEEQSHSVDKHEEEDEGLGSENEEDDESDGEDDNANGLSDEEEEEEEEEEGENSLEQSPEVDGDNDEEEEEDEENEENDNENISENDEGFEDDNGDDDEEDIGVLDEVNDEESLETHANDDEGEEEEEEEAEGNEEDDVESLSVRDLDVSIEGINHSSEEDNYEDEAKDDELDYEFVAIPGVNEIDDDSAEPLEEIEEEEPEDVINEIEVEPLAEEIMEEESTSVAVKFGVGVALVVAAHFVLVRRWNNVDADLVAYTDEVRDLTRRNTIVPPINTKQLIAPGNVSQKHQQPQNLQELKNKYKNLQNENVQLITNNFVSPVGSKQKVTKKELDVRTPSQIKKNESQELVTSESERCSGTENESDYDYDEDELDDEEVEEEEEEEEDGLEDDEELDDSELVAKLEAKYGKLPTPSQSEEEEEEEEDSEEEEDDEDEEEVEEKSAEGIDNWKRLNAPKAVHSSGNDKTKDSTSRAKESLKTHQGTSVSRGGRQSNDIGHSSDHNELTFQEEIENWLAGDLDN